MSYDKLITDKFKPSKSITVKVFLENGNYFTTGINTDLQGARSYYLNKCFNMGIERDNIQKVIDVVEIN